MAEEKRYSNVCCGQEVSRDQDERSFCQSPDPSNSDELLHIANRIKESFRKKKLERSKSKLERNTPPYVSYSANELLYIPTYFHFIDYENHHDLTFDEAGKRAETIVQAINDHLKGSQNLEYPPRLDNSHGIESRLRLKLVHKVPSSWLNPLFQENRHIKHWTQAVNWNRESQSWDVTAYSTSSNGSQYISNYVMGTDPYITPIDSSLDPTTFYNEMYRDTNFDNYYSIPLLNRPHSRDEYFECGEYGAVFNWTKIFPSEWHAHNGDVLPYISAIFDGQNFDDDDSQYIRNINTKDPHCTTQGDLDSNPPNFSAGGIQNNIAVGFNLDLTTDFEAPGNFGPMMARFPGINLVLGRAGGGKASFPQTRNQWAPGGVTTAGLHLGETLDYNNSNIASWASIWAHELGHSLGLSHSFGNERRAQTRIGHIAPLYTDNAQSAGKKVDFFANTTNGFTPPFEYVDENGSIQDYSTLSATETTYIENMLNNGARDATAFFSKRLEFNRGDSATPMSVTNTHLVDGSVGRSFSIYFAALNRFSSFWGGSYITHADGTKEMVVNPTVARGGSSRAGIADLQLISGNSLPSIGTEYQSYWFAYDIVYYTVGLNIFCDIKFLSKYNRQENKQQLISDNTPALQYSGDPILETQQRYITAQSGAALGSFPNPDGGFPNGCAVSVASMTNSLDQDFVYIGYRKDYEEAKESLLNSDVDWGYTNNLYNNYFAHNNEDARVWTLTKDIPTGGTGINVKVQLASLHSDSNFNSSNPSDKRYWYLNDNHPGLVATSGDGLLARDVYSVPLRKKTFIVSNQSQIDQITSSGLLNVNFIPVEEFENRKGPQITTYVPFCKIEEQTDPSTGVTSFVQTDEFDPFWYVNLNWLNSNYPKYPDNWPVSKIYDATDSDGNPLCPCLHTVQHYYYEKPEPYYTDSETGELVIPYSNNLVEYIPINAKTEDLVYTNGSNVINSDRTWNSPRGGWNYYGNIPTDNGTDAYKLNMLYNYLDYKFNLTLNSQYGSLMSNVITDDGSADYYNTAHFFGVPDDSSSCGKQMTHNAFMEVYVNSLEFDNFYPSVRRYGSRIHSWPHAHGIFFEHHVLEHNCPGQNCDSPKIEVPYWGYTGVLAQVGIPKELKLNTYAFADLAPTTFYSGGLSGGHTSFSNIVLEGYELNIDGIDDTGRDTIYVGAAYTDQWGNAKGGNNTQYHYGNTFPFECYNQVLYAYNQFYFTADITLRYFFGSSDPNAAVYNPFRAQATFTELTDSNDFAYHYKVNTQERVYLNGAPAISCRIERGLTNNIMTYPYNNTHRSHPDNIYSALNMPNSQATMSTPRDVFSPDQIARMEAIVESRFSYLNEAMRFADEIDLHNAVYSTTSDIESIFTQAHNVINNAIPNQTMSNVNTTALIILGNIASVDMTDVTVYNVCLDKSPTICNGYNAFMEANINTGNPSTIQILGIQLGLEVGTPLDAFMPSEPGTYGPVLQFGQNPNNRNVFYWDQSLCCEGTWSTSAATCLVGESATLDCTGCITEGLFLDNSEPYNFILNGGIEFAVSSGVGLPFTVEGDQPIIAEEVFTYNNSYYLYSSDMSDIVPLTYAEVTEEKILEMQKFNKVKGILNKMSNFAK